MSWRCDRLLRAGSSRAHVALYIPASFTVQAGNRAGRLAAPTLPHTHDPHVEDFPTLADGRTRLRPAQTESAQHSKTMPQLIAVMPAHGSDRPTRGAATASGEPRSWLPALWTQGRWPRKDVMPVSWVASCMRGVARI